MGTNYYIFLTLEDTISTWSEQRRHIGRNKVLNIKKLAEFFYNIVERIKENKMEEKLKIQNFKEKYEVIEKLYTEAENGKDFILTDVPKWLIFLLNSGSIWVTNIIVKMNMVKNFPFLIYCLVCIEMI